MEKLDAANKRLKSARDDHENKYADEVTKLDHKENGLVERLKEFNKKKLEAARSHGNEDALGEDLVEINAGGRLISVKRSTLTQIKGTRLETLFSGRYDKVL